ncbi:TonB-dependent receptor domain-containing protein [Sphingomonas sp. RB1R13]|uniref:TonB-dependent receptor domain-containing protein n=1 Tax=Sphingomonas sp. RB1R13 TaxID=3096159 RepID=UPI002FCB77B0
MSRSALRTCVSLVAIAAATSFATSASAQTPTPAPAASTATAPAQADEIVVTASSGDKTRLKSSISVSQVSQEAIANFTPRSETEIFRLIPGIHAEDTAGPGGNANIGVRGIPVITGGSEFVGLQEDGLPVTLFGDIQFGNNDYWIRFDNNVDRIEAVRGGSSSTFSSQAPGAVINYISKTGDKPGGEVGISTAINYNETRFDGDYGARLSPSLRFHVGGFVKQGHGPTHIGYRAVKGYQIKGNITQDLGTNGYIRVNFKRLDDREPTFTNSPTLVTFTNSGGVRDIEGFSPFPGFDARKGSNQSIYNESFQTVSTSGQLGRARMEGIHPKATAIGGALHYNFGDHFTVHDDIRYTKMKREFATQFLNVQPTSGVIGSTVNGQTVGSIRYANGPKQGQLFTGAFLNNNPNIDTIMRDMGSFANDLALTGKFDAGFAKVTAKAGLFVMRQNISQEWHVNPQTNELTGTNPAQLDLFSTTGTQLSAFGQSGFNNNWGDCCARSVDLKYTDTAPYFSLNVNGGGLDLDASVRFDDLAARGTAAKGVPGPNFTVTDALGTAVLPSLIVGPQTEMLHYNKKYTSWSLGALYAVTNSSSIFGRVSKGGRFNADRRTLGGNFNADGSLNTQGQVTAVNFVTQQEVGIKTRGPIGGGRYSLEVTGFRAQLIDNNYDFTRINNPAPNNNPIISNGYKSYGLEATLGLHLGKFSLVGDATYSHSRITASATSAIVGKIPHSTPSFYWVLSPSYDAGIFAIGASANGQNSTYADDTNTVRIPGQTYVNGFVKIRPIERVELGFNVNNLFNTLGYRGSGSLVTTGATTGIFQNSAVLGRTMTASIRYKF